MRRRVKGKKDVFERLSKNAFRFLEERFGCRVVAVERRAYGTYIVYLNSTMGVRLSLQPREGGIFVDLVRLINGKIPEYPIFVKSQDPLHWFDLEDLVGLRAPHLKIKQPPVGTLCRPKVLKEVLVKYANLLQRYASDVLKGDFKIFPRLEKIVRARAKESESPEVWELPAQC